MGAKTAINSSYNSTFKCGNILGHCWTAVSHRAC